MASSQPLSDMYRFHNAKRGEGFTLYADERGSFFSKTIGEGKRILDIGCRDGVLTQTFFKGNTVVGYDIDDNALAHAKKRLPALTGSLVDLNGSWPAQKPFDVVVAAEVLEHLYYPDRVLQKVSDSLKPGGLFIGSVPNAFHLKNRFRYLFAIKKGTPLQDPTHINQFSVPELHALLSKYFTDVQIYGYGSGPYSPLKKLSVNLFGYGLMWRCKKKK